jgi:hypothetical protein
MRGEQGRAELLGISGTDPHHNDGAERLASAQRARSARARRYAPGWVSDDGLTDLINRAGDLLALNPKVTGDRRSSGPRSPSTRAFAGSILGVATGPCQRRVIRPLTTR